MSDLLFFKNGKLIKNEKEIMITVKSKKRSTFNQIKFEFNDTTNVGKLKDIHGRTLGGYESIEPIQWKRLDAPIPTIETEYEKLIYLENDIYDFYSLEEKCRRGSNFGLVYYSYLFSKNLQENNLYIIFGGESYLNPYLHFSYTKVHNDIIKRCHNVALKEKIERIINLRTQCNVYSGDNSHYTLNDRPDLIFPKYIE